MLEDGSKRQLAALRFGPGAVLWLVTVFWGPSFFLEEM